MSLLAAALLLCFQAAASKPDIGHEAALSLQAGKYAEAEALLQRAVRQSPKDARLWTLNGLALVQLEKPTAALASFNRALNLVPDYVPALEGAAQLEFQNDPTRAVDLLHRLLKVRPEDQTSHSMLAALAFKQGDCDTVRKERASYSEIAGLQEYGACLVNHKRLAEAIPVYQQLVELQPGSEQPIYSLAVAQFLAGTYSEVIRTVTPITQHDPSNADALELLAEAYEFSLDSDRALTLLEKAIAANPQAPGYYTDFAYICLAHGKFQTGIETLSKGLANLPNAAPLYVARGLLSSELGKFEEAENDFQSASRIDPSVELGSAAKGLSELQQNDLPHAESTARERLALHPHDAFLNYLLAEVLARKGDTINAIPPAETAVRLKPDLIVARNLLARLYLQAGRTKDSIEQSRLVYRANPGDQTALYHLILALRKGNRTDEIPSLLRQLARLKEQSRGQENFEQEHQVPKP